MTRIRQALENARVLLQDRVDSPVLDSQILLTETLGVDRVWLYSHSEDSLDQETLSRYENKINRRAAGEPVAYITGKREFWSLMFRVTPDTLIPRPETEHLVEAILAVQTLPDHPRILDFGTGSGAIAISLAHERPAWRITAIDISQKAIAVARQNAADNAVTTVEFLSGEGLKPVLNKRFDVIVSNPPYIPENDPHLQQGDVRYEPRQALASGTEGLDCIRYLVQHARNLLVDQGHLLLEHGYDQGPAVRALFQANGYNDIFTLKDLGQMERITGAIWNGPGNE